MKGRFCLVLHGHLPWVLHHGRWPHGEHWLFEAAAETWIPLLLALETLEGEGIAPKWTVGLTPILLEQLRHPRFQGGFAAWLSDRQARAETDLADFRTRGDRELASLAERQVHAIVATRAAWVRWEGDLVGALSRHLDAGHIGLMGSNSTHVYHPLVLHDATARAAIRVGLATTRRHFGRTPRAVWLPECAYRPPGLWTPIALHGDVRWREGVGTLWDEHGIEAFVVDSHLLAHCTSAFTVDGPIPEPVGPDQRGWDARRAWGDPLAPHRVAEGGRPLGVTAFARSQAVSEPIWSGAVGYPGDGAYLEFHKRHGADGHRYWRVTRTGADLGDKAAYVPHEAEQRAAAHAEHFHEVLRGLARDFQERTGRGAVVVAPFDAELFGHWWHEGPAFLVALARRLASDPTLGPSTLDEVLDEAPADKAVLLPEGSWGSGGDHRVWAGDDTRFYWEFLYRAEDRFLALWSELPWRTDPDVARGLRVAARELLLLGASDWAFVISTRGAVDYGIRRIADHAARFDAACLAVVDAAAGRTPDPVVVDALRQTETWDEVFADVDLEAWAPSVAPGAGARYPRGGAMP